MSTPTDVVVIGAGHNGLACACYPGAGRPWRDVLEAAGTPGGCIHTVDLPGGRGRLEVGAYEHGGIRASGVAADLELVEGADGDHLAGCQGHRAARQVAGLAHGQHVPTADDRGRRGHG